MFSCFSGVGTGVGSGVAVAAAVAAAVGAVVGGAEAVAAAACDGTADAAALVQAAMIGASAAKAPTLPICSSSIRLVMRRSTMYRTRACSMSTSCSSGRWVMSDPPPAVPGRRRG